MTVREPLLQPVAILDLHPTQITVAGLREVEEKRKRFGETSAKNGPEYCGSHLIPVVRGPRSVIYIVDRHDLALTLHNDGVRDVIVTVIANLSNLDRDSFWFVMDHRKWTHPFDADGRRRPYSDLPKSVDRLITDPFLSLVGALRRAGGLSRETTPFNEFLWADFLRRRMKRKAIENNFTQALEKALQLAKSQDANYLPGWCGPVLEE
jgi:hypothetical protein